MTHGPRIAAVPALLLAATVLACGDGTGPRGAGLLEVTLHDSPPAEAALGAPDPIGAVLAHHKSFGKDYYHGALEATLELWLVDSEGRLVPVAGPVGLRVALQAPGGAQALRLQVPAGDYEAVVLALRGGSVSLSPGSSIGGLDLTAERRLSVAGGGLVEARAELASPLRIRRDGSASLGVDLESEAWITEDRVLEADVPAAWVAEAIAVGVGLPAAALLAAT